MKPGVIPLPNPNEAMVLVAIERYETTGESDRGKPTGKWVASGSIQASFDLLSGQTLENARSVWTRTTHRVRSWALPWLTSEHRLLVAGQVYEIGYVDRPPHGDYMEVFCAREEPGGP